MSTSTQSWNQHERSLELVKPTYKFIDTSTIINRFAEHGWTLHSAQQAKVRTQDRDGHQKHLLRFRNPMFTEIKGMSNDNHSVPELVVQNAHDCTSALKMLLGIFRTVCMNGVISGSKLGEYRVVHTGTAINHIDAAILGVVGNIPLLIDRTQRLAGTKLTDSQCRAFAARASQMRLEHVPNVEKVNLDAVLWPRRIADTATDAFTVFNRIQEKVIRGGIPYVQMRKNVVNGIETFAPYHGKTRAITSVTQSVKFNRELWDMAEETIA